MCMAGSISPIFIVKEKVKVKVDNLYCCKAIQTTGAGSVIRTLASYITRNISTYFELDSSLLVIKYMFVVI